MTRFHFFFLIFAENEFKTIYGQILVSEKGGAPYHKMYKLGT